jgi:hypothetical protein
MFAAIRRASSLLSNLAAEPPARVVLEIDICELLAGVVFDNKARDQFFD